MHLERADRESELADWLDEQGLPSELAGDLVGAGITARKTGAAGEADEQGEFCRADCASWPTITRSFA